MIGASAVPVAPLGEPFVAIVNGAAGGGRCAARAREELARLAGAGVRVDAPLVTTAPGHASELAARAWDQGRRRFLSVGGDGTAYEILNGLFPRAAEAGERPQLGLLPLGTGNSFLRDYGVRDVDGAARRVAEGAPTRVDVVRAAHTRGVVHYMNLLGLGFAASAGDLTNRRFKRLGPAGYVAAVLVTTARLAHPVDRLQLDEGAVDGRPAAFLSFSNSQYTGGAMRMAPSADASDGKLDVIRCGAISRGGLLTTFPKIFRGRHVEHPLVEASRAQRVRFLEPREQPCMIDGEIVPLALESLEVLPGALEVFL